MLFEPAQKLLMGERHLFHGVTISIVFVTKLNVRISYFHNAMTRDGNLVGVPSQILYYLSRSSKGTFSIYIPSFITYV